jgi:hypothetical protein
MGQNVADPRATPRESGRANPPFFKPMERKIEGNSTKSGHASAKAILCETDKDLTGPYGERSRLKCAPQARVDTERGFFEAFWSRYQ